jgi:penicillin amidase
LYRPRVFDRGQSGVLFDKHYSDQAQTYINGGYVPQHLSEEGVAKHAQGTLRLVPAY